MKKLKVGLVGLGNIGNTHIRYLTSMDNVELVGVCDVVREVADRMAHEHGTKAYYRHEDLFRESGLEAVVIGTPHYFHVPVAIDAFAAGLHVLCEKPLAVHVNDGKKMIDAYDEAKKRNPLLLFGIMFQERTYPFYQKIKDLLETGELGQLTRATWINTTWFRTQAYYDSGTWRATWAGEGGGILTNQCPHNLDMYQWLFGMPDRISAHAHIGKYHHIEVEDEVTAYMEHGNGMIGHFIVTTAESPGTNRLEVVGEHGKLVLENSKLMFYRNRQSMLTFLKESTQSFAHVENWVSEIPVRTDVPTGHHVVAQRFIRSVLEGKDDLYAHGLEGMNGLALANGMMLSSFKNQMVSVPFDADEYEDLLQKLIQTSTFQKSNQSGGNADMSASFNV